MSKGRTAPIRPSIAKILRRQIGGFVREYERELNRPAEPAQKPKTKQEEIGPRPETPAQKLETQQEEIRPRAGEPAQGPETQQEELPPPPETPEQDPGAA